MPRDQQVIPGMTASEPPKTKQGGIPAAQRRRRIEQYEQVELFRFLSKFESRYPHMKLIYSSGNGIFMGYDAGAKRRAATEVQAGLRAGVWDIFVPCPRLVSPGLTAHGMYLEMKTGIGKLSLDQEYFGAAMKRAGYVCVVARSWHEAARAILEYLADCPAAMKALPDALTSAALADARRICKRRVCQRTAAVPDATQGKKVA